MPSGILDKNKRMEPRPIHFTYEGVQYQGLLECSKRAPQCFIVSQIKPEYWKMPRLLVHFEGMTDRNHIGTQSQWGVKAVIALAIEKTLCAREHIKVSAIFMT